LILLLEPKAPHRVMSFNVEAGNRER